VTDQAGPPSEIEIQTSESPTVYTRSFVRTDDQDVLTTTASNAEVVLTRNWNRISDAHDWVAPLGILLSIGLGLLTTDFVARFGVSAEVWKATFMVGAAGSAVWLIRELIMWWRRGPALTPQEVVALLMTPPPAAPSKSALTEAKSVGGGNSREEPQTYGAGCQVKATTSSADPKGTEDHVSMATSPNTLSAHGRWHRPTSTAVQGQAGGSKTRIVPNSTTLGDLAPKVSPGERVRHPNFGVGTVLDVRPGPGHTFVEVKFDDPDVGTKKLREDRTPLQSVEDELAPLRPVEDGE
jgi:hypothetical protein